MKKTLIGALFLGLLAALPAAAEQYVIDTENAHASIHFRIKHLGYSWLYGRFDRFQGQFSYDEAKPESATVKVAIDTASIDSNHAERDKHLRGPDFFDVQKFPEATFVSTAYRPTGKDTGELTGTLTLHGVSKPIIISVSQLGAGADPWGGFRRGFYGTATLRLADFGMDYDLGPASREAELMLSVEGIRQ